MLSISFLKKHNFDNIEQVLIFEEGESGKYKIQKII